MCLFGLRICSIAIVVCHGFKTKTCVRLLLISNLIIEYSDYLIPMFLQKIGYYLFLFFICSYKKSKKKYFFLSSGFCGIRTHNLE